MSCLCRNKYDMVDVTLMNQLYDEFQLVFCSDYQKIQLDFLQLIGNASFKTLSNFLYYLINVSKNNPAPFEILRSQFSNLFRSLSSTDKCFVELLIRLFKNIAELSRSEHIESILDLLEANLRGESHK